MAEGSGIKDMGYVITNLKNIKEKIEMLQGMISHIRKYVHIADEAKEEVDSALYELTGDTFYKPKKEEEEQP